MSKPALTVLAAAALAVLVGCSGGTTPAHSNGHSSVPPNVSVCGFLKSGGLVAVVNRPGVVTSGESVTLEASNPGPIVRLAVATLTVGGNEGVSGNVAWPGHNHGRPDLHDPGPHGRTDGTGHLPRQRSRPGERARPRGARGCQ